MSSSNGSDSDDDDLPAILSRSPTKKQSTIKSADEILTPRRSIKPDHEEPISPSLNDSPLGVPSTTTHSARRRGKQVSMSDLLKEKKHDDEIQSKIVDIMKLGGRHFLLILFIYHHFLCHFSSGGRWMIARQKRSTFQIFFKNFRVFEKIAMYIRTESFVLFYF